jgi:hypothetical protein
LIKRLLTSLVFTAPFIVISSCAQFHYITNYSTHLSNSDPASLVYKDTLFGFEFHPVPNGLYFNITNLSNVPATLEWDKCYFIEPTGNPSRALNVDGGIREDTHLFEGARNESIIPPHTSFGRFTTSALNVEAIKVSNSYYYFYNSFGYSSTTFNTFYDYGRYWPEYKGPVFEPADSLKKNDISLPQISSYVSKNNNMGVGFHIRLKDTVVDYKFDFKIDKIAIYKVHDTAASELAFYAIDTSDWTWQKAPSPIPNLLLPGNGEIFDSLPVILRWNKPIGVSSIVVQVSADSLFQSIISQDTAKIWASKSVYELKNNGTYFWRVSANFTDGKSGWSAPHNFVVKFKNKKY